LSIRNAFAFLVEEQQGGVRSREIAENRRNSVFFIRKTNFAFDISFFWLREGREIE
jgi:hypothetical protein